MLGERLVTQRDFRSVLAISSEIFRQKMNRKKNVD